LIVAPTDAPISFPLSPTYARNIRRYVETALECGSQVAQI
jgi:hypothetical protein